LIPLPAPLAQQQPPLASKYRRQTPQATTPGIMPLMLQTLLQQADGQRKLK